MTLTPKTAFLGAGNMAGALIGGLTAGDAALGGARVWATDPRAERRLELEEAHGIKTGVDNAEAARWADIVVLAVKPQVLGAVLGDLEGQLGAKHLVISVAAGVSIRAIEAKLGPARVIRAMPNTPALVGAGATAFARGPRATSADAAAARDLFESVGVVLEVEEDRLDAVTGLSGSGPAYVFRLVEGMVAGGIAAGLTDDDATLLAVQTVAGAARLLRESTDTPARLREKVTSPGGTTQAGLDHLAAHDFHETVKGAVTAATERSVELGKEIAESIR
ncbi:MAG: pyrroline-5-carboxylate reductase [Deltaproteobacteria bacterium]|nr:MAG: pyrroline-5-carboxylate reductase [Deltaproteobacteria bacterium]